MSASAGPRASDAPSLEPDEVLVGLAHAVRAAGVPVTPDRTSAFLQAVAALGCADLEQVRRAGRATLCAGPEDLVRFEQVVAAWFGDGDELPRAAPPEQPSEVLSPLPGDDAPGSLETQEGETVRVAASDREVLRHRDVATLGPRDKALLDRLLAGLRPHLPQRRSSRRTAWRRGEIDVQRTLRTTLRQLGEPGRIAHRRRTSRARRVVLLIDVSGSMRPYAEALLRLAHVIAHAPGAPAGVGAVEVFTLGTRLTRITEALRSRDVERALVRAGDEVPDWSGGTRLGEVLGAFVSGARTRHLARGALVVVVSDGWERGDARELGEQLGRLHRLAHRVVWANPHRGKVGYRPVQAGIVAVLPHVDDFVAGHSVAAFEELLEVIARG